MTTITIDIEDHIKETHGETVHQILQLALAQRAKGVAKYGQGVEDANLMFHQWVEHALEEQMDQMNYLISAAREFRQMRQQHHALHSRYKKFENALANMGLLLVVVADETGVEDVEIHITDEYTPPPEVAAALMERGYVWERGELRRGSR